MFNVWAVYTVECGEEQIHICIVVGKQDKGHTFYRKAALSSHGVFESKRGLQTPDVRFVAGAGKYAQARYVKKQANC